MTRMASICRSCNRLVMMSHPAAGWMMDEYGWWEGLSESCKKPPKMNLDLRSCNFLIMCFWIKYSCYCYYCCRSVFEGCSPVVWGSRRIRGFGETSKLWVDCEETHSGFWAKRGVRPARTRLSSLLTLVRIPRAFVKKLAGVQKPYPLVI